MNKTFKTFALLCMGLVAVACVEENLDPNEGYYDTTPGNDITFTATANIEDGNAKTKTVYGDAADTDGDKKKDKIDINWAAGDKIQIASLEAAARQTAEYKVIFDEKQDGYTGSHTATSLEKTGDAALQWSEADTYNFYAMYPSPASFTTQEEMTNVSLKVSETEKVMYAWLPTTQLSESHTTPKTGNQVIEPNMKYAYMHAASSYSKSDADGNPNQKGISLQFESAVTALQFDITANTIASQGDYGQYITIKSVTLRSQSGLDLSGKFSYDFNSKKYAAINESTGYSYITMSFGAGYTLYQNESLDITFFLLPQYIPAEDLRLQIMFSIGGREQTVVRTATIKNEITARRKYCYNNLLMPAIAADVEGSNWVSALDPNTYLTQISVPVAGNAFSSYYTGDSQQYNIEQIQNYQTLWNMGVRGFEFKTAQGFEPANNATKDGATGTVKDEYFVTNGQEMTGGPTFDTAFTYLAQQLLDERYDEEFLVIIATYQSYSGCGAYDPQGYINDLEAYFRGKSLTYNDPKTGTTVTKNVWKDMIVKLSSNSIVGDLKGKIAVVVRPADNEYIKMSNAQANGVSYTALKYPTDTKLMYVDNWGTAVDCWDRRFSGYNRQMVFGQGSANTYIENYLYAIASNNSGDTPVTTGNLTSAFKDGYPATNTLTDDLFKFNNGVYMIQEFARVVPANTKLQSGFYANVSDESLSGTRYLWVRWPESFSQKTKMIEYLLSKSMSTIGSTSATPLFINSLSGYYVTQKHKQSHLPYAGNYYIGSRWNNANLSCSDAGMGGDIAGLAGDLNIYLYNKLLDAEKNHQQGPLGLIIMNYIGAEEDNFAKSDYYSEKGATWATNAEIASSALPNMILMNNFKFPLTQAPADPTTLGTVTVSDFDNIYLNGGEAISFE